MVQSRRLWITGKSGAIRIVLPVFLCMRSIILNCERSRARRVTNEDAHGP